MRNRLAAESRSSFFVSTLALILWLGASVGANLLDYGTLSVFLMFVFLLCLTSRIWGNFAVKNVTLAIDAPSKRLFPGEEMGIEYTITNDKFLPLIWLEVIQTLPDSECLMPKDEYDIYAVEQPGELYTPPEMISKKKFSFVLWHQTLKWSVGWVARKRGLYKIDNLRMVSGDGLGMAQNSVTHVLKPESVFVVYPKIVPVNIEMFLQSFSHLSSSSFGYMDDRSVVKGIRDYMHLDSLKQINWRITAREQKLQVNMYETILPKTAHFIIDGESYQGLNDGFAALENALSIVASIALRLSEERIESGISLPKGAEFPAVSISPAGGAGIDDVLYYLSAYQCVKRVYDPEKIYLAKPPAEYSEFNEQEMSLAEGGMGKVYFVTYSEKDIVHWELLERIGRTNVTVLTSLEANPKLNPRILDYHAVCMEGLKQS